MNALILIIPIVLYLPIVIVLHRFRQVRAERQLQRRLPTQGIALKATFSALVVEIVALVIIGYFGGISVGWCVWAACVVSGLGYCYWALVCVTESARRYMIAAFIEENPGITRQAIVNRYNRYHIIASRLERLEHWGTLSKQGDRYRARPNSMLVASVFVRAWAQILGFDWPRLFKRESSDS